MSHTPGPWEYQYSTGTSHKNCPWEIIFGDVECIAESVYEEADARLIAAAPDMLAALKAALEDLRDVPGKHAPPSVEMVEAAIAKATGGAT